jgi:hypothetical protein
LFFILILFTFYFLFFFCVGNIGTLAHFCS